MSVILRFTTRRQFGKYNHIFSFSSAYVCMFYELPCLSVHVNFSTVPEICLTSNVLHGYWWVSLWCHLRALGQTEPLRLLHRLVRWSLYCSYILCVLVHQGSPCIPSIIRVSGLSVYMTTFFNSPMSGISFAQWWCLYLLLHWLWSHMWRFPRFSTGYTRNGAYIPGEFRVIAFQLFGRFSKKKRSNNSTLPYSAPNGDFLEELLVYVIKWAFTTAHSWAY